MTFANHYLDSCRLTAAGGRGSDPAGRSGRRERNRRGRPDPRPPDRAPPVAVQRRVHQRQHHRLWQVVVAEECFQVFFQG